MAEAALALDGYPETVSRTSGVAVLDSRDRYAFATLGAMESTEQWRCRTCNFDRWRVVTAKRKNSAVTFVRDAR